MLRRSGWLIVICFLMTMSCKHFMTAKEGRGTLSTSTEKTAGGDFMLKIEDADLVQDSSDPESNTAEWSFSVAQPGRYEVWLSSITCDTMNMGFDTAVTITAGDSRLEKVPMGDEIIANDNTISTPWYRADSEMGSVFFNKAGEYTVQVISEKVVTPAVKDSDNKTLIKSIILKPVTY